MKRKKETKQKTPLKQTRISNFFKKGECKRARTNSSPDDGGSPDVIICTPTDTKQNTSDAKKGINGRKSLLKAFNSDPSKGAKPSTINSQVLEKKAQSLFHSNASTATPKNSKVVCSDVIICETTDVIEAGGLQAKNNSKIKELNAVFASEGIKQPVNRYETQKTTLDIFSATIEKSSPKSCHNNLKVSVGLNNEQGKKSPESIISTASSGKPEKQKGLLDFLDEEGKNGIHESPKVKEMSPASVEKSLQLENLDSAFFENTPPSSEAYKTLLNTPVKISPKKVLQTSTIENSDDGFMADFDFPDGWSPIKPSQEKNYPLSFESCTRCTVVSSEFKGSGRTYEQVVVLKEASTGVLGRCLLRDVWAFGIEVSPSDDVNVMAKKVGDDWVVDAQNGYVCLYPDLLVSSTSLTGAMFCRRRGVLSDVFKGLDTDNKIMTMGSLVHELLQEALKMPNCSKEDLDSTIHELLRLPSTLRMLYACNMTVEETELELNHFIPFILNFLKTYVTQEAQPVAKNFTGVITEVVDIEENVSSLSYGVKGRVDATVKVKHRGKNKLMPLELKTGRASFSVEHRSQVILYTMMMSDVGNVIESGLLLYIKEGIMEEIIPNKIEIRDLILLRNDFAKYIKKFDSSNLPEAIRLVSGCKRCPYVIVCTAFLNDSTPATHPIRTLDVTIEPSHLQYFHTWSKWLLLEDSGGFGEKNDLKLTGLSLGQGLAKTKSEFKYVLKRCKNEESSLAVGNFVNTTSDSTGRCYRGRIIQMSLSQCTVALDKEVSEKSGTFSIEAYRSTLLTRYMSNLGHLLEEPYGNLREIIIDQKPAKFAEKLARSTLTDECMDILKDLNKDQQRAVLKVLTSENYLLVQGPPGSGKTQTIAALIRVLLLLKQTVLLVGHTHSCVDNVLSKLPNVEFLRMGSLSSIHPSLHDKSYAKLVQNVTSMLEIQMLLNRAVLASTCLGLDTDIMTKRKFDVCIVDESSQVLQPEVLKPLFAAKKFVLIGDPKQLGPVVKNSHAKDLGMSESIFDRLYNESSVVTLTYQYRMNRMIMDLANYLTYDGILKSGSTELESKVLLVDGQITEKWLLQTFSPRLEHSIMFLDTSEYLSLHKEKVFSCSNAMEVEIVTKIVDTLLNVGVRSEAIGVMAPFRAQIQKLTEAIPPEVEVSTVDQYQGRDKDVIIISLTRQDRNPMQKGGFELLNDEKRLNVAVTRAKYKLIFVGDRETMIKYKTFNKLFGFLKEDNFLTLQNGVQDFFWPVCEE